MCVVTKENNPELYNALFPEEETYDDYLESGVYVEKIEKENQELQDRIDKAIEYSNNCLENLKNQEDYMCESIDIVSLLKMIHKNYSEILKGESK